MANTLASPSYVFSFKLVSGFNQITLPNNVIVPNLKQIIVRKLSYAFNQQYQYEAKLSIVGYDLHTYFDGLNTSSYTLSFFNPSGALNNVIEYTNVTSNADINLTYGAPMSQFTLVFDTDYSNNTGSLGAMSIGGSPYVTPTNPLFIEIEFR